MKKLFVFVFVLVTAILLLYFNKSEKVQDLQIHSLKIPFEKAKDRVRKEEQKEWLYYLASPELEGRGTGEKGNELASQFIANFFLNHGFLPANNGSFFQPFSAQGKKTSNVIAYLPGNDKKDEFIIIGAHFDHLGKKNGKIYFGADDNASGTTALLGISQCFSLMRGENKRTIIFIAFSGEEMGLLGSKHYCKNPIFPLNNTVVMINLDMVGRYKDSLECIGANSSKQIVDLIGKIRKDYDLNIKIVSDLSEGGSDHVPFVKRKIPICFFFTGFHPQYHKPEDKPELINYDGLEKITKFVFQLAWELSQSDERPIFNDVGKVSWKPN